MKRLLTALVLLVTCQSHTYAQGISKSIDAYVSSYAETGDFNGCILISEKENLLYQGCFGNANYSFDVANQTHTKFKIGSISKQFTAAAILLLEQDGMIKTTDTISRFFDDKALAKQITVEHLLTHTSGVADIFNLPGFNKLSFQKMGIADLSAMLLEVELDFKPGSQYQYSNGGFALLAQIIELVSGETYQEFLNRRIFKPLKMNDTGHNRGNEIVTNLAVGYDPSGYSELKITDYIDPELLKGSGSLYSTVYDLQTWIQSIKNQTLLDATAYNKMLQNYGNGYGYGISVYRSFDQSVFGHDGRINGYIADYLHYIEPDISIILLGNIQTGVADFFRRDIAAITFNKEYQSRAKTVGPADQKTIEREKIIGTYAFGPNFKVYIEYIDGKVQARANEGGYSELVLLNDGRFFSRTLYSYIAFKKNDQGEISKMVWINNDGNQFEGIKE